MTTSPSPNHFPVPRHTSAEISARKAEEFQSLAQLVEDLIPNFKDCHLHPLVTTVLFSSASSRPFVTVCLVCIAQNSTDRLLRFPASYIHGLRSLCTYTRSGPLTAHQPGANSCTEVSRGGPMIRELLNQALMKLRKQRTT
jgi:hypothetical protein